MTIIWPIENAEKQTSGLAPPRHVHRGSTGGLSIRIWPHLGRLVYCACNLVCGYDSASTLYTIQCRQFGARARLAAQGLANFSFRFFKTTISVPSRCGVGGKEAEHARAAG